MNTYATTAKREMQIALLFRLGEDVAPQLAQLEEREDVWIWTSRVIIGPQRLQKLHKDQSPPSEIDFVHDVEWGIAPGIGVWDFGDSASGEIISARLADKVEIVPDTFPKEVIQFCEELGILRYLGKALDLIKTCFSPIEGPAPRLAQDPETEDRWLVLDITVEGEVEDVLKKYDNFINLKVKSIPWPERDKIRLAYNIL